MSFTRFYSWSCDMKDCHRVEVQKYIEHEIIPEPNLPVGWYKIDTASAPRYACPTCVRKYGGIFLEKLYPVLLTSDPGAKGGDKITSTLINAHAVSNISAPISDRFLAPLIPYDPRNLAP